MDLSQDKAEAESFLRTLINKTLRIRTTDSRLFVGTFKCTDPVRPHIHTNYLSSLDTS